MSVTVDNNKIKTDLQSYKATPSQPSLIAEQPQPIAAYQGTEYPIGV